MAELTVRVRSRKGMRRYGIASNDTVSTLLKKIEEDLGINSAGNYVLKRNAQILSGNSSTEASTLESLGFKNGEMLLLELPTSTEAGSAAGPAQTPTPMDTVSNGVLNGGHVLGKDSKGKGKAPVTTGSDGSGLSALMGGKAPKELRPEVARVQRDLMSNDEVIQKEQAVDRELVHVDGQVKRQRTPYCNHRENAMCDKCSPVDPWDQEYLADHGIKHMSFNAYIRQQTAGKPFNTTNTGTEYKHCVEEPQIGIRAGCVDHPPWPEGVCSKCQPGAVTLKRQPYRHVDYIEFDNLHLVDRFLQFWRESSGAQRWGFLYGRYERHAKTPLGIKAVVSAIYEPAQTNSIDSVDLKGAKYVKERVRKVTTTLTHIEEESIDENGSAFAGPGQTIGGKNKDNAAAGAASGSKSSSASMDEDIRTSNDPDDIADEVARRCGLQPVGWIFTDLEDDGTGTGKVRCHRSADTYYLSSYECCLAADLQNRHPNYTRFSADGRFGSKYVTVCATGDEDGGITTAGYQVSEQCVSLFRDGCMLPARDPAVAVVPESTEKSFVPEVFYGAKNEYGIEVTKAAAPTFPLEYVLVQMEAGAPQNTASYFAEPLPFPIENRELIGKSQTVRHLKPVLDALQANTGNVEGQLAVFSNFHLLLYLANSQDTLGTRDLALQLCDAVRLQQPARVLAVLESPEWKTLEHLVEAEVESGGAGESGAGGGGEWQCTHCTYLNHDDSLRTCDMCGLDRM
eukprot:Clim_evm36s195 gene=Clim_evmTU36s195